MNALLKTSWNCVTLSGTHERGSLQNQRNFCQFMPQRAQVCPVAKGSTNWCLFYYIVKTSEMYQKTDCMKSRKQQYKRCQNMIKMQYPNCTSYKFLRRVQCVTNHQFNEEIPKRVDCVIHIIMIFYFDWEKMKMKIAKMYIPTYHESYCSCSIC